MRLLWTWSEAAGLKLSEVRENDARNLILRSAMMFQHISMLIAAVVDVRYVEFPSVGPLHLDYDAGPAGVMLRYNTIIFFAFVICICSPLIYSTILLGSHPRVF